MPKKDSDSSHSKLWLGALWVAVIALALGLRFWQLANVPAGMHQDEAWFAYNAFLLKTTGANIYGERWPLTVDMWGDHVSSFHSFSIIPFITLFGVNTFAFRLPFVLSTLVSLGLGAWLLWRWTHNRWIPLLFGFLAATSQWNIIMSRASSTVVLDTLVTLLTITLFYEGLRWLQHQAHAPRTTFATACWWVGVYSLTVLCYFTYFTSRLTLPIFLVATLLVVWFQTKLSKKLVIVALSIILAYAIFPFGVMLRTPYALGRYQETTIINSPKVQNQIFLDISRSGQGGIPAWLTRIFFNKVTENGRAIMAQYVAFFSPSVVLFQSAPPARYFVPQAGVINWIEYLGFLLALAALLLVTQDQLQSWRVAGFAALLMMAAAIIPTALTIDDFPNFQRGVYVTPFWQMAAAIGWGLALHLVWHSIQQKRWRQLVQVGSIGLLLGGVLISLAPFGLTYYAQSRYANVFNRSRAGEKLGAWVNEHAHDARILMDHDEANFLYPYMYAQENVRQAGVESSEHYMLKAPQFRIGQRTYVHKLCQRKDIDTLLVTLQPDYVFVKKYPPYDDCHLPAAYQLDQAITFDDGTVGYEIYRFDPNLQLLDQ